MVDELPSTTHVKEEKMLNEQLPGQSLLSGLIPKSEFTTHTSVSPNREEHPPAPAFKSVLRDKTNDSDSSDSVDLKPANDEGMEAMPQVILATQLESSDTRNSQLTSGISQTITGELHIPVSLSSEANTNYLIAETNAVAQAIAKDPHASAEPSVLDALKLAESPKTPLTDQTAESQSPSTQPTDESLTAIQADQDQTSLARSRIQSVSVAMLGNDPSSARSYHRNAVSNTANPTLTANSQSVLMDHNMLEESPPAELQVERLIQEKTHNGIVRPAPLTRPPGSANENSELTNIGPQIDSAMRNPDVDGLITESADDGANGLEQAPLSADEQLTSSMEIKPDSPPRSDTTKRNQIPDENTKTTIERSLAEQQLSNESTPNSNVTQQNPSSAITTSSGVASLSQNSTFAEKTSNPIAANFQTSVSDSQGHGIVDQISQPLREHISLQRDGTLKVNLEPADLGQVSITLQRTANGLAAQMVAAESITTELLITQQQDLKDTLVNFGFEEVHVDVSHQDENGHSDERTESVSYTHLTLPTISSV